jgi:predicted membrane protein
MRTHFSSLDIWDEKYDILGAPELKGLSLNLVVQEVLFFKMSPFDYRLKGGEFWLKQLLLQLVIIACTKFVKRN